MRHPVSVGLRACLADWIVAVLDSPKGHYRTEPYALPLDGALFRRCCLWLALSGGRSPRGHDKSELGASAWRTAHTDGSAVGLNEAFNDVQAKTGTAAALAPPELAEHAGRYIGRDALA